MSFPPNPKVADLREQIEDERQKLGVLFKEYPDSGAMPHHAVTELKNRNARITALQAELDNTPATQMIHAGGGGSGDGARGAAGDSIGAQIVNHEAFKSFRPVKGGAAVEFDVPARSLEQKAVLDTATGFAPQSVREPLILEKSNMPPRIADLFGQTTTDQAAYVFMEETTFTNAAAETAEAATKPQSTLVFTEKSTTVRKIATEMTLTEEVLMDTPRLADYLNSRVGYMVQLREDQQLLTGDGVGANLRGVNNFVGIQTQAKGADPTPDAVYKAMILIFNSVFVPADTVVMHPADWQDVRLLRTADGRYIFGDPAMPGPETIFGARLVLSTRQTQNTALVGAFKFGAAIARRSDLTIRLSTEHASNFTSNLVTLVAEERIALVPYRAGAFCTVTGV